MYEEEEWMLEVDFSNEEYFVTFARTVLEDFRKNVGRYPAEAGGLLGSKCDMTTIDFCCFDLLSVNTSHSFYYDVESMTNVYRQWKSQGIVTNGIYHSHPPGVIRPSFHDISSAWLHMKFFRLNYFYLPILQPHPKGVYKLYLYVVYRKNSLLQIQLLDVIQACEEYGYQSIRFDSWEHQHTIDEVESYQSSLEITEDSNNEIMSQRYKKLIHNEGGKNDGKKTKHYKWGNFFKGKKPLSRKRTR